MLFFCPKISWYEYFGMNSFNNTRLNFLYLFPIIMSHSEKSEYMAPLLKVWLSFYTNMHVYSCCMFAHAYVELSRSLASLRWVSTCADDCETTTSPKLTDRISRSNRYDSASGLHVLCTHFCLRLGISEFTKWQKPPSAHSPTDNISHNALKPSLWTVNLVWNSS